MVPLNEGDFPVFGSPQLQHHFIGIEASASSTFNSCLPNTSKTTVQQPDGDTDIMEDEETDDSDGEDGSSSWTNDETPFQQRICDLIEIQGICHIDLVGVQFKITHNEETNDFFVDLVQSEGCLQSVLQVIFRFPVDRNGLMEIFASSYDQWTKPGRVVVYSNNRPEHVKAPKQPFQKHHWHLQLHVYEHCYTIELNGRLIETFDHRMAFRRVHKRSPSTSKQHQCAHPTSNFLSQESSPAIEQDAME